MRLIFSAFVLLLLTRCAREVNIDLPEEAAKVVAVCNFTPGGNFRVSLSFSQPLDAMGAPKVPEKAEVSIAADGQFYDRLFKEVDEEGEVVWQGNDVVKPGVEYSLRVNVPGYPPIEANSSVPNYTPVDHITLNHLGISVKKLDENRNALIVPIDLHLSNKSGGKSYFAFNLSHETEVFELENGVRVPDYSYETTTFFLTDGPTLSLLHNISEPVVLVNEKYWSADRSTLRINAYIPYKPDTEEPKRIFIEWRTLSEEFYRYHLSVARQGGNLPLNDPDAVFNNVQGGYGNFSGYSVAVDTVEIPR